MRYHFRFFPLQCSPQQLKWMGTRFKRIQNVSFELARWNPEPLRLHAGGVNDVFSNHFGISVLPETWITARRLFIHSFLIIFFFHFKTSPHLLQLLRWKATCCRAHVPTSDRLCTDFYYFFFYVFSNHFWILGASTHLDYTGQALRSLLMFILISPSTSVVEENAATLFCCEAPETFRGLQIFPWLSIQHHEGEPVRTGFPLSGEFIL